MKYIEQHNIELPEQYPEVMGSLECWSCTAIDGDGGLVKDDARMAYMEDRYPHLFEQVKAMRAEMIPAIEAAYREVSDATH